MDKIHTNDIEFDQQHIWHPYTSMTKPLPAYKVTRAEGVTITLETGEQLIDGMASWWSVVHGYNHPEINQAMHAQIDAVSHVMFGGLTHQPAIDLCRRLIAMTPDGLDKVFIADSGSVAVEVAIKMALQYWHSKGKPEKSKLMTVHGGYHGDTFAAMSVCDPVNGMHQLFQGFMAKSVFAPKPKQGFDQPWDEQDSIVLEQLFATHHQQIAAFIIEPIVQGAGGMRFYHPQYLKQCRLLCDKYDVLLIADEIATGFGRTGKLFACEHANVSPDILCLGKALTGGYLTLAATLCTKEIADTISQGEAGVFMHGPTFMGNPLACSAANASLALLSAGDWQHQVASIESTLQALYTLSDHPDVADVRVLGAIGVVEMKRPVDTASIQAHFVKMGVWIRPFGKLVYIMPPYVISQDELLTLIQAIKQVIEFSDIWAE
ncbi:adenosylmethionine--8-amino-7-oxononanoate transaminase [Thalassotalea mangrovi]|uniref:Adenosylmethionine-8-amino-7-oxononanoate aminotransferase n=1 Tax=Thalassotalea mangrovi TaxID=2572245 RepID=A0A4V5NU66_9GAMM|nr:adenosylmethionine--8-amino-7-oxononanoate transaminase [Thalassotalea mangrovi]TKB44882.1 adenosylmethionine--8-amino-7-oxononanoate transaminase [Thalassotalea mangrovi]